MNTQETMLKRSFGFNPQESEHHFRVHIPRGAKGEISISEHFTWEEESGSDGAGDRNDFDAQVRAILVRPKWDAIADEVRVQFNQRLRKLGRRSGGWVVGINLVRRELGKELVLLAWAIEEADPGLIPAAIANWRGLVPEERWWLYTQTAAATGQAIADRGKGWRLAVRYALTENPVTGKAPSESVVPEFYRRVSANAKRCEWKDEVVEEVEG
jgi:hypothetical protein